MVNNIVELCRILEREGDALRIANAPAQGYKYPAASGSAGGEK